LDDHSPDESIDSRPPLSRRTVLRGLGALAAGSALAACTSGTGTATRRSSPTSPTSTSLPVRPRVIAKPGSLPNPGLPAGTDTLPQIEHIIVLMLENHSYDDHFGMLRRGDGFRLGANGLPLDSNRYTNGRRLRAFHMPSTCQLHSFPSQSWTASHVAYDKGHNDGFVAGSGPVAMGYWDRTDIPFYYGLGETFPVCDRYFCSTLAQTFPNRRFLIAGTAAGNVSTDVTALLDAKSPPNGTILDRLEAHGISWLNYFADLPTIGAVPDAYVKYHAKAVPNTQFATDAAAGKLPSFCIVDPDFGHQSEENPQDLRVGEQFAAGIINAAMHGPGWDKTILIWTYDEHGGYYDHVPPPAAIKPDGIPPDLPPSPGVHPAYDRYGFRVPTVIVSPYARRDYVSSVVHDHTSILKLVETKWNLPAMTYRDANASNLLDSLDLRARRPAFADPPDLPAPALAAGPDSCTPGDPGGTIPPAGAVIPA
jgi:phospholipase C